MVTVGMWPNLCLSPNSLCYSRVSAWKAVRWGRSRPWRVSRSSRRSWCRRLPSSLARGWSPCGCGPVSEMGVPRQNNKKQSSRFFTHFSWCRSPRKRSAFKRNHAVSKFFDTTPMTVVLNTNEWMMCLWFWKTSTNQAYVSWVTPDILMIFPFVHESNTGSDTHILDVLVRFPSHWLHVGVRHAFSTRLQRKRKHEDNFSNDNPGLTRRVSVSWTYNCCTKQKKNSWKFMGVEHKKTTNSMLESLLLKLKSNWTFRGNFDSPGRVLRPQKRRAPSVESWWDGSVHTTETQQHRLHTVKTQLYTRQHQGWINILGRDAWR